MIISTTLQFSVRRRKKKKKSGKEEIKSQERLKSKHNRGNHSFEALRVIGLNVFLSEVMEEGVFADVANRCFISAPAKVYSESFYYNLYLKKKKYIYFGFTRTLNLAVNYPRL